MSARIIIPLVLLAIAPLAFANQAAPQPDHTPEGEVAWMQDTYRAVTAYHVLLTRNQVSRELVSSVLHDIDRYLEEVDSRLGLDELFIEDERQLALISKWAAKAHLQAALLHARGVDLERSIDHFERVIDLLGHHPVEWDEPLERKAQLGLLPGASEFVFEMASPRQVVDDLKRFWGSGVVTRFEIVDLPNSARGTLQLERAGGAGDPFSQSAFELARERFGERTAEGLTEFRVVLPPGLYTVTSSASAIPNLEVRVLAGSVPDPVIVSPHTFTFQLAVENDVCRPELVLNGVVVPVLNDLPYGSYLVRPNPNCTMRVPDKISVRPGAEVSLRTEPERLDFLKEGQPIFLFVTTPPASTYTLRF